MSEIISREDARAAGLFKFNTGKPCVNNHLSDRYVMSGNCVECARQNGSSRYRKINVPQHHADYVEVILKDCARVTPENLRRCQTDANHNLWLDGLWEGRWDTREDVVRYMWEWLIKESREG